MRKQLLTRNVADAADAPRIRVDGNELHTWTPAQVRIFLDAIRGHRLEVGYLLAVTTGMRRGEFLGLRWGDVDFKHGRLAVQHTLGSVNYKLNFGAPKTPHSRRMIALDPATLAALAALRARQRDDKKQLGDAYKDQGLIWLFGFHRGLIVASSAQLGFPA